MNKTRAAALPSGVRIEGDVEIADLAGFLSAVWRGHPDLSNPRTKTGVFLSRFKATAADLEGTRVRTGIRADGLSVESAAQIDDDEVRIVLVHIYDGTCLRRATVEANRQFLFDWLRDLKSTAKAMAMTA